MIIELDEPVGGCTHAEVDSQTRVGSVMVRLDVGYGTMEDDEFVRSVLQGPAIMLNGAEMVDFIEEVKNAPGRPASKPDHEFQFSDLQDYLKTPKAERLARIDARKAEREAETE